MLDPIPLTYVITGGIFVMACAWFNFKSGLRKGQEEGIEFILNTLADNHVIEIQYKNNSATIVRGNREGASLNFDKIIQ